MVQFSGFKDDFLERNYIKILLQCFVWKLFSHRYDSCYDLR
jgi:hypothetical protein